MIEEWLFPQHIGGGSYKMIRIRSSPTKIRENLPFCKGEGFCNKVAVGGKAVPPLVAWGPKDCLYRVVPLKLWKLPLVGVTVNP